MPNPTATSPDDGPGAVRFSLLNWALLAAGLVAIVLGYLTLAQGSTVIAPLLLVAGYVVLVPLGIIA
jgi:hypothetical protein